MKKSCVTCGVQIKQGFVVDNGWTCTQLDDHGRCVPIRPKKHKKK